MKSLRIHAALGWGVVLITMAGNGVIAVADGHALAAAADAFTAAFAIVNITIAVVGPMPEGT